MILTCETNGVITRIGRIGNVPSDIQMASSERIVNSSYNLLINPDRTNTGFFISGDFNVENQKHILQTMGIVLDGKYRENTLTRGVFDYIEKYVRTNGSAKEGLYCYQFCLDTNPHVYQPSWRAEFREVQYDRIGICDTYTTNRWRTIKL